MPSTRSDAGVSFATPGGPWSTAILVFVPSFSVRVSSPPFSQNFATVLPGGANALAD